MPALAAIFLAGLMPLGFADYDSPLDQLKAGTPIAEIACKEGKILLEKNLKPYCVGVDTAERLEERGWSVVEQAFGTIVEPTAKPTVEPSADPINTAVASLQIESPVVPGDIAAANNAFAVDFYRQVSDNDDNIFFSPASMYTAFSILYEGARGNTAEQLQDVFGLEPDAAVRYNSTAHMMASINRDDSDATLNLANALWIADWFEPDESYLETARSAYLAGAEKVEFSDKSDEGGIKRINQWASDNTNNKIDEVLKQGDVDAKTAMVITNAIYFKGTWDKQFPAEDTRQSEFWKNDTQSVDADFMHVKGKFGWTFSDGVQVLKLPYKGDRLSMLIALPDDRDGIEWLQEAISDEMIQQWQQRMGERRMEVSIPKFEMRTNYDLMKLLPPLGVTDVFNKDRADLLGILGIQPDETYPGENLYVSKATQDAYVKVNEEGTEAAAVTGAVATPTSAPLPFVADRQFIFLIQDDESGMILFMGRVSDPTE